MSETTHNAEFEGIAIPRLTQLAPDLWVDLSEIVSVRTYTDRGSYHRIVVVRLRSGAEYKVHVPGSGGGRMMPVSVGDQLLAEWLDEHLSDLLTSPGQRTPDHDGGTS